jgi:hypothetical protein
MQHIVRPIARPHHLRWVSRAIVSGFLAGVAALFVLIPAYGFAAAVGSTSPTATPLSRALWNLSHNPVTSLVGSVQLVQAIGLHLVVGLGWAVVYAAVVEPKLYGPGWRKGLVFATVPCLISLFVFLPLVGAGPFGLAVGAGPIAGLGAILLHAIYGVLLGETYALADGEGMGGGVDNPMAKAITLVERDMALGLVLGAALGALIAGILAVTGNGANLATVAAAATEGALCGVIIGVVIGLLTAE